ncbi:hypothetical protein ACWEQ4_01030 [Rhodococcus sp. NPDC003994]
MTRLLDALELAVDFARMERDTERQQRQIQQELRICPDGAPFWAPNPTRRRRPRR